MTPRILKFLLNIYPPYIGAGVRVHSISGDWKELTVSMPLGWYNRNILKTHFGGSLYSMVDPHLVLLLMQLLGKDYIVWDKSAEIEFVRPGRSRVWCTIAIPDGEVVAIRDQTESNKPCYPEFELKIVDSHGELVARVKKTLYVKRKHS